MRPMRAIGKTVSLKPYNDSSPTDIEMADGLGNGHLAFTGMDSSRILGVVRAWLWMFMPDSYG